MQEWGEASTANRKWVADFTYSWTAEGWLYVTDVIDHFSRRVVNWSMSAAMRSEVVTDALVMAIWCRGRPNEVLRLSRSRLLVHERGIPAADG